jgi:hypothetical protein
MTQHCYFDPGRSFTKWRNLYSSCSIPATAFSSPPDLPPEKYGRLFTNFIKAKAGRLREERLKVFYPWKIIRQADVDEDKTIPALRICLGNSCWDSITDPHTLPDLIRDKIHSGIVRT